MKAISAYRIVDASTSGEKQYSTELVKKITKASTALLIDLTRPDSSGETVLLPKKAPQGEGNKNLYTWGDMVLISTIQQLKLAGVRREWIKGIVKTLKEVIADNSENPLSYNFRNNSLIGKGQKLSDGFYLDEQGYKRFNDTNEKIFSHPKMDLKNLGLKVSLKNYGTFQKIAFLYSNSGSRKPHDTWRFFRIHQNKVIPESRAGMTKAELDLVDNNEGGFVEIQIDMGKIWDQLFKMESKYV